MATKILITGSCGFIFSNFIIYALQKTDWEIVSIDKLTYAGSLLNVPQVKRHKLYIGDICDSHFIDKVFGIENPDIVIHGAAESHVDNSIANSTAFMKTNVIGTQVIFDTALKYNIKKVINVATDEVYGSIEKGSADENYQLNPQNPYSVSKTAADMLGKAYYNTHKLPIITIRPSNNFGPRQHTEKFVPKIITNILLNKKVPLYGNGTNKRQWLYVLDHFEAIKTIIEKGIIGETYNIGTENERKNIEVIDTIFEVMGADKKLVELVQDRPGHDLRYSVDYSKLMSLGWSPQFGFKEAIIHTIGWYKANSWFWNKK
jgi:dTDP-glucose 4,6-dehydratase